jgi:hypothetical protein
MSFYLDVLLSKVRRLFVASSYFIRPKLPHLFPRLKMTFDIATLLLKNRLENSF